MPIGTDSWQLKEHDRYNSGNVGWVFQIESVSPNRLQAISNGAGQYGHAYIFKNFNKSDIKGKRIAVVIQGSVSTSGLGEPFKVRIYDGSYDRTSGTDFPTNSEIPNKGNGIIVDSSGVDSFEETTMYLEVDFDRADSAQTQCCVMIYCIDAWASNYNHNCYIKTIEVENYKKYDFQNGTVTMEQTGTQNDYGYVDGTVTTPNAPYSERGSRSFALITNVWSYLNIGNNTNIDGQFPMVVGAWINPSNTLVDGTILSRGSSANASASGWAFGRSNANLTFRKHVTSATDIVITSTGITLLANTWQYVAAIVTSTQVRFIHLTLNGTLTASDVSESTALDLTPSPTLALIGVTWGNSQTNPFYRQWQGKIKHVTVHYSQLTDNQVRMVARGQHVVGSNLKMFFPINGVRGLEEPEMSGNWWGGRKSAYPVGQAIVTSGIDIIRTRRDKHTSFLVQVQYARPSTDDSIGSWTNEVGGTTNIYQSIDEVTANDSDFIQSENNPATSIYRTKLSSLSDPNSSTGHIVKYRYSKTVDSRVVDLVVRLKQGTTTIHTETHNGISATVTAGTFTLSGAEADSITDYTNLYLEFQANVSSSPDVFERPDGTIASGGWTATGAATLHEAIDEVSADDDTTYIQTGNNPSLDICEVSLSDQPDPVSSTGHVVSYKYKKGTDGARGINLRVRLLQGATEIAQWNHTAIGATYVTQNQTLSGAQADAITNYNDLRLEFRADTTGGGSPSTCRVTWGELKIPPSSTKGKITWAEFEVPTASGGVTNVQVTDSFSMSHSQLAGKGLITTQSYAMSDSLLLGKGLIISDSFNGTISTLKHAGLVITDTFSGSLDVLKGAIIQIDDTFTNAISYLVGKGLIIDDTLSLSVSELVDKELIIFESVNITDSQFIGKELILSDTFTGTDDIFKEVSALVTEDMSLSYVLLTDKDNIVTDLLSNTVSTLAGKGLVITDTLGSATSVLTDKGLIILDTMAGSVDVVKSIYTILEESLAYSISALVGKNIVVNSTLVSTVDMLLHKGSIITDTFNGSLDVLSHKGLIIQDALVGGWSVLSHKGVNVLDSFTGNTQILAHKGLQVLESMVGTVTNLLNKNIVVSDTITGTIGVFQDSIAGIVKIVTETFSPVVTVLASKPITVTDTLTGTISIVTSNLGLIIGVIKLELMPITSTVSLLGRKLKGVLNRRSV